MSINWIEAYYWASRLQNPASTPGHAAPLARSEPYSCDRSILAPTHQIAQEEMQEPEQLTLFGLKSDQLAQNSDVISSFVTISEPQEPAN